MALKLNNTLKMLVLSRNDLQDDGVLLLTNALLDKPIETLGLDATNITYYGIIHVANLISKNKYLSK